MPKTVKMVIIYIIKICIGNNNNNNFGKMTTFSLPRLSYTHLHIFYHAISFIRSPDNILFNRILRSVRPFERRPNTLNGKSVHD